VEVQLHAFLSSAIDGGGQFHVPPALPPEKEPPHPLPIAEEDGRGGEEEKFMPLQGIELRSSSA
jgi:hypothetical protein